MLIHTKSCRTKKINILITLFMAIVMMAMPAKLWAISGNGSSSNPYQITNASDWATFRDRVSSASSSTKIYAKLIKDITLTGNYTPVGTNTKPFCGELDGNNKTITIDSYIQYQSCDAFGLFAYIDGAYIHDLKIEGSTADSKILAQSMIAGTLVGKALNSSSYTTDITKIYNVQSSVNLMLYDARGYEAYGGIVGELDGKGLAEIKGCTYSGKITASSNVSCGSYGGIVGIVAKGSQASIEYCLFSGRIETLSSSSDHIIGGILGTVHNSKGLNDRKLTQYFNGLSNCFCGGDFYTRTEAAGIIGGASEMTISTSNTVNNYYLSGMGAFSNIYAKTESDVADSNKKITVKAGLNGTISITYINPSYNASTNKGTATQMTVKATADKGYDFVGWTGNNSTSNPLTITPNADLTANFALIEAKAVLDGSTLTFYYDAITHSGNTYSLPAAGTNDYPAWHGRSITKVVFDASFANSRPVNCGRWFYGCSQLTTISGIANLNTSNVTDMTYMFSGCNQLTSLDVSKFNTASVTNMQCMFSGCSQLTSLDVSNFNTASVTDMRSMFYDCSQLTSLDVSNFNTASVENMNSMFYGCSQLTSLDVSNFNTASVTNMGYMFSGCSQLSSLDLSNFNTASVKVMYAMFYNCSQLTSLDLSNFNTASVEGMMSMFSGCSKLTSLDVSNFNTASVTGMYSMFKGCSQLTSLDVSNFNTASVTNMKDMFSGCSKLTSLDVSNFNTASVTDMTNMFKGCSQLTSLDVSKFNTASVTNMKDMFSGCSQLTSLDVSNFNTASVTDMADMFYNCSQLTSLTIGNFDMQKVKSAGDMFYNSGILKKLTLKSVPFLKDGTFNSKFSGAGVTVNYQLDEKSTLYSGTNYLPAATNCNHYFRTATGNVIPATCVEAKKVQYKCSLCEEEFYMSEGEVDLNNHDFSLKTTTADYFKTAATCTEAATYYYKCSRCEAHGKESYVSNEDKDKVLGHDWNDDTHTECNRCKHSWIYYTATNETTSKIVPINISAFNGLYKDENNTFDNTTKKGVIELPRFLECLGGNAFSYNVDLTSITFSSREIGETAFFGCDNLTTVTAKETNKIGNGAFSYCCRLTSIIGPDVTSIEASAFLNCQGLKKVSFPHATNIGGDAFKDCYVVADSCEYNSDLLAESGLNIVDIEQEDGVLIKGNEVVFIRPFVTNVSIPKNIESIKYFKNGINYDDSFNSVEFHSIPKVITADMAFSNAKTKKLILTDDSYIAADKAEFPSLSSANYTRDFKANWNTVCLPFEAKSTDDVKLYVIQSLTDGVITLKYTETLAAGLPALAYSTSATTLNITGSGDVVTSPVNAEGTNRLVGTFSGTTVKGATDTQHYLFGLSANTGKYVKVSSDVDLKPFRAYIECSKSDATAGLRQVIADEDINETAISDVVDTLNDSEAQYYDINGRRLNCLQKGMNIIKVNGTTKKVMIK